MEPQRKAAYAYGRKPGVRPESSLGFRGGGTCILEGEGHREEGTSESPGLEKDQMWYLLGSNCDTYAPESVESSGYVISDR